MLRKNYKALSLIATALLASSLNAELLTSTENFSPMRIAGITEAERVLYFTKEEPKLTTVKIKEIYEISDAREIAQLNFSALDVRKHYVNYCIQHDVNVTEDAIRKEVLRQPFLLVHSPYYTHSEFSLLVKEIAIDMGELKKKYTKFVVQSN